MMFCRLRAHFAFFTFVVFLLLTMPSAARENENGELKIHVVPKQAYVFVDGNAIRDGSQTITLPPGSHELNVYNYGYIPDIRQVHINPKTTTDISVDLKAEGNKVSGPLGYPNSRVIHVLLSCERDDSRLLCRPRR